MIVFVVMVFVLLVASVSQMLLAGAPGVGELTAPVLLGVVIYYALCHEPELMLVAAVGAGILQDSLSPIPLGYSALCFCVYGAIISRLRETVFREVWITPVMFGGVGGAVMTVGLYVLLWKDGLVAHPLWWGAVKALGCGALGMACTPAVFVLARRLDRLVRV